MSLEKRYRQIATKSLRMGMENRFRRFVGRDFPFIPYLLPHGLTVFFNKPVFIYIYIHAYTFIHTQSYII